VNALLKSILSLAASNKPTTMFAKSLHPDVIRVTLRDISFAPEPFGVMADGAQSKRLTAVEKAIGRRTNPSHCNPMILGA